MSRRRTPALLTAALLTVGLAGGSGDAIRTGQQISPAGWLPTGWPQPGTRPVG